MGNLSKASSCIIEYSYAEYHSAIINYVAYKINNRYDAEDLAQDVFVRLIEYKPMLRKETSKYFVFTIARNLVIDYLRRFYKKQKISAYMYERAITYSNESESRIIANNLLSVELKQLNQFPTKLKLVYTMNRFQEKSTQEISEELNLSHRTVENHLLLGRKRMRSYMKKCI